MEYMLAFYETTKETARPWNAIETLYTTLNRLSPTIPTMIGHAAVLTELGRFAGAAAILEGWTRGRSPGTPRTGW